MPELIPSGFDPYGGGQTLAATAATRASAILTANTVAATNTVTIDGKTYTFTATPAVEGDVYVTGGDTACIDNLKDAINGTGTPGATSYIAAAKHPTVEATTKTGTTILKFEARTAGGGGNLIRLAATATRFTWAKYRNVAAADVGGAAASTLTGGLYSAALPLWNFANIITAETNIVKSGPGILHSIVVGTGAAGTVIVYDALSAVAPIIATVTATATAGDTRQGTYTFDCEFRVGLTVVTSASTLITVIYR